MAKKKKIPFHTAHNYKKFVVPSFLQYGKHQGDTFYAKDEKDSVIYLNKLVSLRA